MPRDLGRQTGSVLLLVPAGVLVLVILGALAVDAALAFLGQRALTDAAAAAANDVAATAVSDAAFYADADGHIELDHQAARRVATDTVARQGLRGVELTSQAVEVTGAQVCVRLTGRVRYLFSPLVPGTDRSVVVHGRALVSAVRGQGPSASIPSSAGLDC